MITRLSPTSINPVGFGNRQRPKNKSVVPPLDLIKIPQNQQEEPSIQMAKGWIESAWHQLPKTVQSVLRQSPLISIGLGKQLTDLSSMPEFSDIKLPSPPDSAAYKVFGPNHTNHRIIMSTHQPVRVDEQANTPSPLSRLSKQTLTDYFLEECGHLMDTGILPPDKRLRVKGLAPAPVLRVDRQGRQYPISELIPDFGAEQFSCTDAGFITAYEADLANLNQHYRGKPSPKNRDNKVAQFIETQGLLFVTPQDQLAQIRSHILGQDIPPLVGKDERSPLKECFAKLFSVLYRPQKTRTWHLDTGKDFEKTSRRYWPSGYKHFVRNQKGLVNATMFSSNTELRIIKRHFPKTLAYLKQHFKNQGLAPVKVGKRGNN